MIRDFLDFDLESALVSIKSQASLWKSLRGTYSDVRDISGFYKISLDSTGLNKENKLMYLEQDYQWHPPSEMKKFIESLLSVKSIEQVKQGLDELEAKFEEKGPKALLPFDQTLLGLVQHEETQIATRTFEFLLEIIRHEASNINHFYPIMLQSIKNIMQKPELVVEFTILAMPKGNIHYT